MIILLLLIMMISYSIYMQYDMTCSRYVYAWDNSIIFPATVNR